MANGTDPKKKAKKKQTPNQQIAAQGGTPAALARRQRASISKGEKSKISYSEQKSRDKASRANAAIKLHNMRMRATDRGDLVIKKKSKS